MASAPPHTHVHVNTHTRVHRGAHTHTHTCLHGHTHAHTRTRTRAHTHTQKCAELTQCLTAVQEGGPVSPHISCQTGCSKCIEPSCSLPCPARVHPPIPLSEPSPLSPPQRHCPLSAGLIRASAALVFQNQRSLSPQTKEALQPWPHFCLLLLQNLSATSRSSSLLLLTPLWSACQSPTM